MTRRDLQIASRKKEQPWEIGKSFDFSAPCGALRPAAEIGHPVNGKIWLSVNGTEKQKGDLSEMIWNVLKSSANCRFRSRSARAISS
jgi:fumarylpyruvate hydrolase